jgi:hypothetical protein
LPAPFSRRLSKRIAARCAFIAPRLTHVRGISPHSTSPPCYGERRFRSQRGSQWARCGILSGAERTQRMRRVATLFAHAGVAYARHARVACAPHREFIPKRSNALRPACTAMAQVQQAES